MKMWLVLKTLQFFWTCQDQIQEMQNIDHNWRTTENTKSKHFLSILVYSVYTHMLNYPHLKQLKTIKGVVCQDTDFSKISSFSTAETTVTTSHRIPTSLSFFHVGNVGSKTLPENKQKST